MSTNELKAKLYKLVDDTNTSRKGIDYLVNYYTHSLGWSEDEQSSMPLNYLKMV